MKFLIIDGNKTNYMVSPEGDIINKKTNRILKGTIRNGYRMVKLTINGIKKDYLIHRLVAMMYVPNPLNLPQVNHKDKNRQNNCYTNLEWVSVQNNMKHRSASLSNQKNISHKEQVVLDDNWRQYLDSNYWIKCDGTCYNLKTKIILKPNISGKYLRYGLSIDGKRSEILIHKMVYIAFYGSYDEKNKQINHKDGNIFNNHIDNLELVTRSENVNHSYYTLRNNICEICQYDLYGNLLNVYPSMTIAATAIKGSVSAISQVCSGKLKSHKSFIWKKLV